MTLVHGTHAPDAPWTREGSDFRSTLAERLGHDVTIRRLPWTGENEHSSRLKAGRDLTEVLREGFDLHPEAAHFIVAHSHGGNIALYALRDPDIMARIVAVATMGTPFLSCAPRDLGKTFPFLKLALPTAAAAAAAMPLAVVLGVVTGYVRRSLGVGGALSDHPLWRIGGASVGLLVLAFLWLRVKRYVGNELLHRVSRKQAAILDRIALPRVTATSIAVASIEGDEAGWWLSRLEGLGNLPFRMWNATGLGVFFAVFLGASIWAAFDNARALSLAGQLDDPAAFWIVELGMSLLGALLILAFLMTVMQGTMALAPRFVRGHPLGFGKESIVDNWYVRTAVAPQPTTAASVVQLPPPRVVAGRLSLWPFALRLRHSLFYDDPGVITAIAEAFTRASRARGQTTGNDYVLSGAVSQAAVVSPRRPPRPTEQGHGAPRSAGDV